MAINPIAVVQLGLAMSLLFLVSLPLISGTTRGTSGLYRNADWYICYKRKQAQKEKETHI